MSRNPMNDSLDSELDSDPESGFQLGLDFKLSIDSLTDEMRTHNRREQSKLARLAKQVPYAYSVPLNSSGVGLIQIGGPQPGREWIIRLLTAVPGGYAGVQNTGSTSTGAAGAGVTTSLTGPSAITGFDVEIQPSALAGIATITLAGVPGGPYTYYLEESTTSAVSLSKTLNLGTNATATLTVSAVGSGGIVTANLYGTTGVSPAEVTFYRGQNIGLAQAGLTLLPAGMVLERIVPIPNELHYTSDVHRIVQNQQLLVGVINGNPNGSVQGVAVINDQPANIAVAR
jgi:hypothetical protein